jgi:NADPH:quinone reductase-like Zn-dependent oxidoreductase
VNYATAYAGLVRYGNVVEGERVLLHAAAGGELIGSEVYGTASASKHVAIRGFGVDHPIDYRERDFVKAVREIAGNKHPLDLVMDAVGGRSFRRSFSLLRPGGRLVCFGASSVQSGDKRSVPSALRMLVQTPHFNPMRLMSQSKAVIGLNMLAVWDDKRTLEGYIEPLREWMADGSVRPVVAEAFPLERGADAHRFMHERKNVGKVVLTL